MLRRGQGVEGAAEDLAHRASLHLLISADTALPSECIVAGQARPEPGPAAGAAGNLASSCAPAATGPTCSEAGPGPAAAAEDLSASNTIYYSARSSAVGCAASASLQEEGNGQEAGRQPPGSCDSGVSTLDAALASSSMSEKAAGQSHGSCPEAADEASGSQAEAAASQGEPTRSTDELLLPVPQLLARFRVTPSVTLAVFQAVAPEDFMWVVLLHAAFCWRGAGGRVAQGAVTHFCNARGTGRAGQGSAGCCLCVAACPADGCSCRPAAEQRCMLTPAGPCWVSCRPIPCCHPAT